jgi:adenosylcobinamide-phosphate synthase
MFAVLALLAVSIEAAVGYPDAVYRALGHPVGWIGRVIGWCDRHLNDLAASFETRRLRGVATLLLVLAIAIASGWAIVAVLAHLVPGVVALLLAALAGSTMLAQRSLHQHVAAVASALESEGVGGGRRAVSQIVGRDTRDLDEAAISRAAIESLAENFSDGVVAPLFWMVVAGLPGAFAYKAVNTADSMIGHKSERHLAFGWASARFDDLVNLPASRLAALWIILAAALFHQRFSPGAREAALRDAGHHRSPNAGWPEAAMAGALGIRLAGPRSYGGVAVQDRWMGDGRSACTAHDIRKALDLYRIACAIQIAVVAALAALSLLV